MSPEPGPLTEICIPGKLSVVVEGFAKQSLRHWLPTWHEPHKTATCEHAVCTDARRKKYVDFDLNLVLVVGVGSCLQQSLNCLSMSILGSYPQRNTAWFLHGKRSGQLNDHINFIQTDKSTHVDCEVMLYIFANYKWFYLTTRRVKYNLYSPTKCVFQC